MKPIPDTVESTIQGRQVRCAVGLWLTLLLFPLLTACTDPMPDGLPADVNSNGVCSICHGSANNAAPPKSVSGLADTATVEVGAHQSHVSGGSIRGPLPCESCHIVPQTVDQPDHRDSPPAEITWGRLSQTGGLTPVWDRTTATCTSVYCHGATLAGGTLTQPVWTRVGSGQADCGTCHGTPPPLPHEQSSNCHLCHRQTVTTTGEIDTAANTHIDGIIQGSNSPHPDGWDAPASHGYSFYDDSESCKGCHGDNLDGGISDLSCDDCHPGGTSWRSDCTFCHGGQDNQTGAPPQGLRGEVLTSDAAVGAHTAHLTESPSHGAWSCSTCHSIPTDWSSPGHIDGGSAEVIFSSPAGGSAAYSGTTASCSSLYCHGSGKTVNGSVSWTAGAALSCGSCHGYYDIPRITTGEHKKHLSEGVRCYQCHQTIVNSANAIIDKTRHIDGSVSVSLQTGTYNPSTRSCSGTGCHDEAEHW